MRARSRCKGPAERFALAPRPSMVAPMPGRYDHLSRDDLIRLLERRDTRQLYGLVWEREGIEPDRAFNDDFVVLDLDPALSTAPQDARAGATW